MGTFWEGAQANDAAMAEGQSGHLAHPMFALLVYLPQLFYVIALSLRLAPPHVFANPTYQLGQCTQVGQMVDDVIALLFGKASSAAGPAKAMETPRKGGCINDDLAPVAARA